MNPTRRGFITGLITFAATAPAIVRAESLMPVKLIPVRYSLVYVDGNVPPGMQVNGFLKTCRTLTEAVGHIEPGGLIHIAADHCETIASNGGRIDFGGTLKRPVTIMGHGATIKYRDSLRIEGFAETSGLSFQSDPAS